MELPDVSSRELLDIPTVINTFNTGYITLRSISFYTEEEIGTSANSSDIKCFSTNGNLIKTIQTKSGERAGDIAVTNAGDIVYCDFKCKTIMIKKRDGEVEEIIKLQGWTPNNLCVTSINDILVSLYKDDGTQSKVVRYSGSTEKQTIQFDNEGIALYSGNYNIKYITENRNYDICLADCEAGALVVVNQTGKRRWTYTGQLSDANKKRFQPHGITTNSQSQILTSDYHNHCIHILDQAGLFLRYIEDVKIPHGLCVDNQDNLYVSQFETGDVKVIKYLM